jgi:hypothetical protein
MLRRRWVIAAMSISAVLLAAFAAISVGTGRAIEARLREEKGGPDRPGLRVLALDHQRGWFGSHGKAQVRISGGCGEQALARGALFDVDYQVQHWPQLSGPARFAARARPVKAFGEDLRDLVGDAALEARGQSDWAKTVRADMRVPARSIKRRDTTLELADARGRLLVQGSALEVEFRQPHARVDARGWYADARDVSFAWKLRDLHTGVGSTETSAASLRSSFGAADGVKIQTHGAQLKDRVELHLQAAAAKLVHAGEALSELSLQADASGLDAASLAELTRIARGSCGANVVMNASDELGIALRALLRHGLSLSVSRFQARAEDGNLDGNLDVELRPSQGALSLSNQLRSIGQLTLLGPTLSSRGQSLSSLRRWLKPIPGGMRASYSFDNGALLVNDKPFSPFLVRLTLGMLDGTLGRLL